tara:strand:+ start:402 stop:638 length:237 start_codon:yes stop_codon:yes gene_type:complete
MDPTTRIHLDLQSQIDVQNETIAILAMRIDRMETFLTVDCIGWGYATPADMLTQDTLREFVRDTINSASIRATLNIEV